MVVVDERKGEPHNSINILAHLATTGVPRSQETPTPLGSPDARRHGATVGFWEGAVSYGRGIPVGAALTGSRDGMNTIPACRGTSHILMREVPLLPVTREPMPSTRTPKPLRRGLTFRGSCCGRERR